MGGLNAGGVFFFLSEHSSFSLSLFHMAIAFYHQKEEEMFLKREV